jgi:sodium/potassium-transporting ATPase subunit beta
LLPFQIYGWVPEPYQNDSQIPDEAPEGLKTYVKSLMARPEGQQSSGPKVGRTVFVTCEGENPADRENIGEIVYYPYQGIPDYYYPYENQAGYLSPIVFAHLKNPKGNACRRLIVFSRVLACRRPLLHFSKYCDIRMSIGSRK